MVMAKRRTAGAAGSSADFDGSERIVVLHGDQAFLQTERLERLRKALEDSQQQEVETLRHDGPKADLADVLDDLRSFGLMAQHKLVVVAEADPFVTQHREALERYAADPADTGTLVLRPKTWNAAWKLHKAVAEVGRVVKCDTPSPDEAHRWLIRRAQEAHQTKLSPRGATALIDHLGTDLGQLDSELAKLAVASSKPGTIDEAQIEALVGQASEEQAWQIQEAMLSGDAARAIGMLHELVHLAGRPEVLINYFVADLARKLHHAAVMAERGDSPFDICKTLKIWPRERQAPFLGAARRLGRQGSARLLRAVLEVDRRAKSGFGKNLVGLERIAVQFAAAVG